MLTAIMEHLQCCHHTTTVLEVVKFLPTCCGYARVSSTPYQDLELVAESKAGNTAKACLRPSSASKVNG